MPVPRYTAAYRREGNEWVAAVLEEPQVDAHGSSFEEVRHNIRRALGSHLRLPVGELLANGIVVVDRVRPSDRPG